MNIIKLRTSLEMTSNTKYVGRLRNAGHIGLGNPYSSNKDPKAYYWVKTKEEALEKYRQWLDGIINCWKQGDIYVMPFNERTYLYQMINLMSDIKNKKVDTLVCHCINIGNYQLAEDDKEKCHAEILYKKILYMQEYIEKTGLNKVYLSNKPKLQE